MFNYLKAFLAAVVIAAGVAAQDGGGEDREDTAKTISVVGSKDTAKTIISGEDTAKTISVVGSKDTAKTISVGDGKDTAKTIISGEDTAKTINGIECVLVKAGTFIMGSPTDEIGRTSREVQHKITLTQDFWISKYPITVKQYNGYEENRHPVANVNWTQADEWARSVGGRLPTEAQWEFAARGGNKSNGYIYSGSNDLDDVCWYGGNSGNKTNPVGEKLPNELGIYDMSGNVWEWCSDWHDNYGANAAKNPTGPVTGERRVIRGGSWDSTAYGCRVANRSGFKPSDSNYDFGFRVVFPRD